MSRKGVYKVPTNTGNGQTVNATKIGSNFPNNGTGIAIDGNDVYRIEEVSGNKMVRVLNKSTGATLRTFRVDFNYYPRGIAIDGNDLIAIYFQYSPARLRWYNKNTSNNQTATHTKEIRLTGDRRGVSGLSVFDKNIYVTNTYDDTIIVIDKNTGKLLETHNAPSSLNKIYGIATYVG